MVKKCVMFKSVIKLRPLYRPKNSLVLCFFIWKLLLLSIALVSPGPGYDTSTTLLHLAETDKETIPESEWALLARLDSLIRWDAIYFTQIARRGYCWEQEWAFGWGFTKIMALAGTGLNFIGHPKSYRNEAFAGIFMSHLFHLLSVLMLYELTFAVFPALPVLRRSKIAFLAAALHVISPAGIFLSAPYAESCFSFLNFTGGFIYAKSFQAYYEAPSIRKDIYLLITGLIFGVATTVRGNGLLSGLILTCDAATCALGILQTIKIKVKTRRLFFVALSGILMASIAFLPQCLAYMEYCSMRSADTPGRPWCSTWIPSIYAWVQKEYWGVGFLKYWTLYNLPLFLLAAPMLYILLHSGVWAWRGGTPVNLFQNEYKKRNSSTSVLPASATKSYWDTHDPVVRLLAIPQIVLATLALTSYHVQIISRLSSGYPVWYWWLASLITEDGETLIWGSKTYSANLTTRWMAVYAIVQGGLFASFLPPA